MKYIDKSLSTAEQVKGKFKLHWMVTTVPYLIVGALALPTFGLTLPILLYRWLDDRTTEHGVTNKRVIYKRGIISRTTQEIQLVAIETIEISQGILGRIFGYGTLAVTGRGNSAVVFKGIADPMAAKRQIENAQ